MADQVKTEVVFKGAEDVALDLARTIAAAEEYQNHQYGKTPREYWMRLMSHSLSAVKGFDVTRTLQDK